MLHVISICLAIILVYVVIVYNNAISLKNYVKEAFATMDVYLKKRWDLVPNLITIVKEYTKYEKNILNELTTIRTKQYNNLSNNEKLETNLVLGKTLSKFVAIAENYPDLKANETFLKLMDQLNDIENDIADSRKYYNGTVRELNTTLELFPKNIICALFNIKKEKMYNIENFERNNVKVELNG